MRYHISPQIYVIVKCVHGVQYVIYSTRGVVEWLIKHEAKQSALSGMRPLLEGVKLPTA